MKKIKFPSGVTGSELRHYMGGSDEVAYNEKSELGKRLIDKCLPGKVCELEDDELSQLIDEVENAYDIKRDHVGDGGWNALQQYNLGKFLSKLRNL